MKRLFFSLLLADAAIVIGFAAFVLLCAKLIDAIVNLLFGWL
jgi:Na+/melibiose symporter-like transporter